MVKFNSSYPDFSAGEVSPKLYGRFDLAVFFNGGRRVENNITQVAGEASFRTGSVFAAQTLDNNPAFLYTFRITDALSFILEFTNTKLRFYRNNGIVESSPGVAVEVTTPFLTAELFQLKFAQNGVNLYIAHPNHNPQKLTYTSPTSWAMIDHAATISPAFAAGEYPAAVTFYQQRLLYGGSINKPQTLYFSKANDPDDFTIGTGVDDGMAFTISGDGLSVKWMRPADDFLAIGTFGDVLKASGGIDKVITPENPPHIDYFNFGGVADINPTSGSSSLFFVSRNGLEINSLELDKISGGYVPASRMTVAEHMTKSGVTQLASQEGRPNIVWASKNNGRHIGMTVEDSEAISGFHRHTTLGEVTSVATVPRRNDYDQLWQCVKREVDGVDSYYVEYYSDFWVPPRREDFIENTKAVDDALFANLMFEAQKEYIHVDSSLSYYGDDQSVTITPDATTGTDIEFTASGSVFSAGDVGREIWRKSVTGVETGRAVIASYTSATVVECDIIKTFDSVDTIPAGEWYFTTDALSGLDHLEGETVTVVADGGQHTAQVVDGGEITLDRQASVVHIGLGYKGYLETNDIEGGGVTGPAQTKRKAINEIGVRFRDTLYAKTGTSYYTLEQIEMRTPAMAMDRPPLPLTGERNVKNLKNPASDSEAGWPRSQRVIVCQDLPFPCNTQLIVPYASVSN